MYSLKFLEEDALFSNEVLLGQPVSIRVKSMGILIVDPIINGPILNYYRLLSKFRGINWILHKRTQKKTGEIRSLAFNCRAIFTAEPLQRFN